MRRQLLLLAVLVPKAAFAAVLSVPGQYATIQSAVNAAKSGDRIEVAAGTYREQVSVTNKQNLTLVGLGGSGAVTVSSDQPFFIDSSDVDLSGFTADAQDRGFDVTDSTVDFYDVVARNADKDNDGGGARLRDSTVTMDQAWLDANDVQGERGGNLFVDGGSLVMSNSTISNGAAHDGGGVYVTGGADVTISDSTISDNYASNHAGGLWAGSGTTVTLTRVVTSFDHADEGGGGAYVDGATLTLDGSTFDGNFVRAGKRAPGAWLRNTSIDSTNTTIRNHVGSVDSGTVYLELGATWTGTGDLVTDNAITGADGGGFEIVGTANATFTLATFQGNSADSGGALRWSGDTLDVTDSLFLGNTATLAGGALDLEGNTLTLLNSALRDNAAGAGGAVSLLGVDATLKGNIIACNAANAGDGGGVDASLASGLWQNNVFSENTAFDQGGGLHWTNGLSPVIVNDTFAGNAAFAGGAAYVDGVGFTWDNNVVAGQTAGSGLSADNGIGARAFQIAYSLWDANLATNLGGGLAAFALGGTDVFAAPDLMWTADGDCSNDTWKPNVGSPVIDAGDPAYTDPDGSPSDIGAFGGPAADPELWQDNDGDSFIGLHDCNDADALVHPGAAEVCDYIDADCDADLNDPNAVGQQTFHFDADGDQYGDLATSWVGCVPPEGWVLDATDCDDTLAAVNPGALEVCDGLDNDCDGGTDVGAVDAPRWFHDADGDGFGDALTYVDACVAPAGYIAQAGDCDDANFGVHPGALEICDHLDNDCDGAINDNAIDTQLWYLDLDGDSFGDPKTDLEACFAPPGYLSDNNDCDDTNALVSPNATEVCNGIDDDCDKIVDADAIDQVTWYRDADQDSWGDAGLTVDACTAPAGYVGPDGDCNDQDAAFHPFAPEDCAANVDYNCDGSVGQADADGDGVAACDDCDDSDAAIFPGAIEMCDGADNDCDGLLDEADAADATLWYQDKDHDTYGNQAANVVACYAPDGYVGDATDCNDDSALYHPNAPEICGLDVDFNCDGSTGDADVDADGSLACDDCDDGDPTRAPGRDELCDGVDNDCDLAVDEDGAIWGSDWYLDQDQDGFGDPATAVKACAQPAGFVADATDCDDANADAHPGAPEVWYDGVDEACDQGSDYDQDQDGVDALGYASGADCDDTDAAVYPGAVDTPNDGVDQDCSGADTTTTTDTTSGGSVHVTADKGGCGCDTSPNPVGGAAVAGVLGLVLARRRQR